MNFLTNSIYILAVSAVGGKKKKGVLFTQEFFRCLLDLTKIFKTFICKILNLELIIIYTVINLLVLETNERHIYKYKAHSKRDP